MSMACNRCSFECRMSAPLFMARILLDGGGGEATSCWFEHRDSLGQQTSRWPRDWPFPRSQTDTGRCRHQPCGTARRRISCELSEGDADKPFWAERAQPLRTSLDFSGPPGRENKASPVKVQYRRVEEKGVEKGGCASRATWRWGGGLFLSGRRPHCLGCESSEVARVQKAVVCALRRLGSRGPMMAEQMSGQMQLAPMGKLQSHARSP